MEEDIEFVRDICLAARTLRIAIREECQSIKEPPENYRFSFLDGIAHVLISGPWCSDRKEALIGSCRELANHLNRNDS